MDGACYFYKREFLINFTGWLQCCSTVLLFVAELWFRGAVINDPNFNPKFALAARDIRISNQFVITRALHFAQ